MVNTRRKGNRSQLRAVKELEKDGWLVGIVERVGKFIKQKDLFGIGDLICVKHDCVFWDDVFRTEIKIIQITSNKPHPHKKFKEFAKKYSESYLSIEQWVYKDRIGWKKYKY